MTRILCDLFFQVTQWELKLGLNQLGTSGLTNKPTNCGLTLRIYKRSFTMGREISHDHKFCRKSQTYSVSAKSIFPLPYERSKFSFSVWCSWQFFFLSTDEWFGLNVAWKNVDNKLTHMEWRFKECELSCHSGASDLHHWPLEARISAVIGQCIHCVTHCNSMSPSQFCLCHSTIACLQGEGPWFSFRVFRPSSQTQYLMMQRSKGMMPLFLQHLQQARN